jgi:hypothetical protein
MVDFLPVFSDLMGFMSGRPTRLICRRACVQSLRGFPAFCAYCTPDGGKNQYEPSKRERLLTHFRVTALAEKKLMLLFGCGALHSRHTGKSGQRLRRCLKTADTDFQLC